MSGVNVVMAGDNFWAGAAGLTNGISSTGFLAGAASGVSAGFAGGFIYGAGNSRVDGRSLGKGLLAGLESRGVGTLEGGIAGGLLGGLDAIDNHTNFWTGKGYFDTTGAMACQGCKPKEFKIGDKIRAKYVGKFEGQRVFESRSIGSLSSGEYAAFTLPDIGIFAGNGVFSSSQIKGLVMMQHQFGRILRYRIVGKDFYYNKVIAKESMLNTHNIWPYNGIPHDEYWTETWANYLSKQYFGKRWLGMEMQIKGHLNFIIHQKCEQFFLLRKFL